MPERGCLPPGHNLLADKGHEDEEINRASEPYRLLCRELLKSNVEYHRIEIERLNGNYSNDYDRFLERAASPAIPTLPVLSPGAKNLTMNAFGTGGALDDVCAMYLADHPLWDKKTKSEVTYALKLFREIVGVKDVKEYALADFLHFKLRLTLLPANSTRKKELKIRPIVDLIAEVGEDVDAQIKPRYQICEVRTQSKQIERISWLFQWCVTKSLLLVNFARGLGYSDDEVDVTPVRSHTPEELQCLVNYLPMLPSRPEQFFVPLMGLYQGIRQNEGCQLFVRDIAKDKETGLLCLSIVKDLETGQKTKNRSSRRTIPIHPLLIELGFENYWKVRQKLDTDDKNPLQLWPNTNLGVNGYIGAMSNFWRRFVDKYITADPDVDFMSLRKNFINALDQAGYVESQYQPIVGHEPKSVTAKHYIEPKMQVFFRIIEMVRYNIDLSRLKQGSPWK